ncbi:ABC transporter substrate-binding protein [Actinoplanes aureus]|uniref:ABC transporter substrate-binding protein n=1 Tax=Actinoplanes aureus TaxID=2792083 RepID=A0A931FYV9_9ACTN|nr:ABC transporter substrate-binding protein [Actinoplanes aureus]MBG0564045.1 ABC transporter substrate-binding protein [Actinoplanes aureus]
MRRTLRIATGVLALGALLALNACSDSAGESGEKSKTLTIGTMTPARSMDPVDSGGGSIPFYQAVYDTLIKREPDGKLSPMLASAWKYDPAGTRLTLTVRDGVTFDDGKPVDAQAVKANLDRFRAAGAAENAQALSTKSVEVVDPKTVVITLNGPDPALLDSLSDAYGFIANPAKFGQDKPFATTPDGTGPYRLNAEATMAGTQWTFTRKDKYWGQAPPFDTVTIHVFDNENAIVNGLKTNQIRAAVLQSVDQQVAATSGTRFKTAMQEIDLKLLNIFDRKGAKVPALGDPRVRQAINYAIDRDVLVEQIQQGRGTATSQMWGTQAPGYVKELDGFYRHDPAKAKALLAEAGYPGGFKLTLPRLTALVPDSLAEAMKSDLAAVGITLTWDDLDRVSFLTKTFREFKYPGVVMNGGQPAKDWATVSGSILPKTIANPFGDTDATIQDLTAKIRSAEPAQAAQYTQQLNRHIVEQAWYVPLYRMQYLHVTVPTITVVPQAGLAVPALYNYQPAA